MAQMKDCASIQKLALACGRYFRYLLGRKGPLSCWEKELKCLDSYMEIRDTGIRTGLRRRFS